MLVFRFFGLVAYVYNHFNILQRHCLRSALSSSAVAHQNTRIYRYRYCSKMGVCFMKPNCCDCLHPFYRVVQPLWSISMKNVQ